MDRSKRWQNKPVIISEFGAGAIYGYRNPSKVKWTEEKQCDILQENLKEYLYNDDISGGFIWQFCDCRVTEGWSMKRPRTKNNKGVVDEHRNPKLAYGIVKDMFLNSNSR